MRWLNSLGGRITLLVILALFAAQLIAILGFTRGTDREQSEVRTEGIVRQLSNTAELLNNVPTIDRRDYVAGLNSPGTTFWVSPRAAVADTVTPEAAWPELPRNWPALASPDKRIQWFADTRSLTMRYSLAPYPTQRNLRGPGPGPEGPDGGPGGRPPPPPGQGFGPPGGGPSGGPPNMGENPPPPPDGRLGATVPGPPPDGRPPPRWRIAVQLDNGQWLNAEQMYELGLPPWLRTVLYQNGVILLLTIFFVVPAVTLATRRLSQLALAADRLGRGEETEQLPESGSTEIKRLTQAFNNMSLRLRRFVQGRTQMLAGISHDLRTPITALRLRTDLVDDEENRDRMQHLIDEMHHLTEGTLTLAKDESFTEKSDKVDISSLIEGICDDLTDAGIDVTSEVQRGVTLICRPYSLRRAIRNIAENGVKYGTRAKIYMTGNEHVVRIIVEDEGPGIPEDQMDRAFQPFVRLEESRSRETGGSGLGLAITRSIILNHGGEIALANRSEGGLRVTVTLPKAVIS